MCDGGRPSRHWRCCSGGDGSCALSGGVPMKPCGPARSSWGKRGFAGGSTGAGVSTAGQGALACASDGCCAAGHPCRHSGAGHASDSSSPHAGTAAPAVAMPLCALETAAPVSLVVAAAAAAAAAAAPAAAAVEVGAEAIARHILVCCRSASQAVGMENMIESGWPERPVWPDQAS